MLWFQFCPIKPLLQAIRIALASTTTLQRLQLVLIGVWLNGVGKYIKDRE